MDVRQLEMLLAAADHGSYSRAGEALHISHSAIHRQVRLLAEDVGDRLLVRVGRGVQLTETGRLLCDLMRTIRREIRDARRRIGDLQQLEDGDVRIGTGTSILYFLILDALRALQDKHPRVRVHLMTGTAEQVVHKIACGELDLGIVYARTGLSAARGLHYEPLYEEEFVIVVPNDHPLAKRRRIPIRGLCRFPLIAFSEDSHTRTQVLDPLFQRAGTQPNITMELENEEAIERMMQTSGNAGVLTRHRAMTSGLRYLRLKESKIACEVWLVSPPVDRLPHAARVFCNLCRHASRLRHTSRRSR
ncbi:MAG: LysR family transcriptional regulator [Luteitalea sp.]|nr:LysR family transcriptional regulator [Luteitalea sp.]